MWEDLRGIEFYDAFWVNGLLAEDEDGHFADVMVSDSEDCVKALGLWKLHNEIYCDGLKW